MVAAVTQIDLVNFCCHDTSVTGGKRSIVEFLAMPHTASIWIIGIFLHAVVALRIGQ